MFSACVSGGKPLFGRLSISGSKNSSLPLIAASLLCSDSSVINGAPDILDVRLMCELISSFGADIKIEKQDNKVEQYLKLSIKPVKKIAFRASEELTSKIRASILVSGAVLSRFGYVEIYLPGGCKLGKRPIEMHLKALQLMGAEIEFRENLISICTHKKRLKGANIELPYPSVGVTENILMAAVLADGKTKISRASIEPEVLQLYKALNSAGAEIQRLDYDSFIINGVDSISGFSENVIKDRIELFTYAALVGACGGSIEVVNANNIFTKKSIVIDKLRKIGVDCSIEGEKIIFSRDLKENILRPTSISSAPYPGFPSDLQPQFAALLSFANGVSVIEENVYSERFQYVKEFEKMGFSTIIAGHKLFINGKCDNFNNYCANVKATDLRAAAALLIAALGIKGETKIENFNLINRGYENLLNKMNIIGAQIEI